MSLALARDRRTLIYDVPPFVRCFQKCIFMKISKTTNGIRSRDRSHSKETRCQWAISSNQILCALYIFYARWRYQIMLPPFCSVITRIIFRLIASSGWPSGLRRQTQEWKSLSWVGVFWSTNVGVGSNPTSDKGFVIFINFSFRVNLPKYI